MERENKLQPAISNEECYKKIFDLVRDYFGHADFNGRAEERQVYEECLKYLPEPGTESQDERIVVAQTVITGIFEWAYNYSDEGGYTTADYAKRIWEPSNYDVYKDAVKRLKEEGNSIINITKDAGREWQRELRIAYMKAQGKKCYEVGYRVNTKYGSFTSSKKVYAFSSDEAQKRVLEEYKCRLWYIKELVEKDWE